MSATVVWLFSLLAVYWAYCIAWGWRGARRTKTASDHFVAGHGIGLWVFVLAATATSLSAWVFLGHAGLAYRDGFPYATAGLLAITVPLSGVLFLKRQWMLGRRFGYLTAGEMYADYYRGEAIRVLTVVVAVLFAVPLLALQFKASGYLIEVLTDGMVGRRWGMGIIAVLVLVHVAAGGLRAVARVGAAQFVLLALGLVIVAFSALDAVGGWEALQDGLARLGAGGRQATTGGHGGGVFNAAFAIPGVIQFTAGIDLAPPVGGPWTGVMCLTFLIALMGVQASPAFTMWSFSNASPRAFAAQQVWASSFAVGLLLVIFAAGLGMGARLLGAEAAAGVMPASVGEIPDTLVPHTLSLLASRAPWLAGLIAAAALVAMQAVGTAYLSTTGSMLSRDLYRRYLDPKAGETAQVAVGLLGAVMVAALALWGADVSDDALVLLGGLAVAFGVQMVVPLAGLVWFPWITRQGATWGLAAGLLGVFLTEFAGTIGLDLWGRWPWTIHSAAWGLAINLVFCGLVSALTQDQRDSEHRMTVHGFLTRHAALPAEKKGLRPVAWIMVLAWLFFGAGPGAVIGNDVFGAPGAGVRGWTFGIPSLWAWQILFWLLGVGMMWFLAYKMEMSTMAKDEFAALTGEVSAPPPALETPSI